MENESCPDGFLISESYVANLLSALKNNGVASDDETEGKILEEAGMKVFEISASVEGACLLLEQKTVDICCLCLTSRISNVGDRVAELAAGILANMAVHRQMRCHLILHPKLLNCTSESYLISNDVFILFELTRLFCSLVRPVGGDESRDYSLGEVFRAVVMKLGWVLNNGLDLKLLAQSCEFLLLLHYYEPSLFKDVVEMRDSRIVEGLAEVTVDYLAEFQSLPQGSKQAEYVIDLLDIVADILENLSPLHRILPALADCVIAQSLPLEVVYKATACLSRLHKDARKCVEMPVDSELATSLIHLVLIKSCPSCVVEEILDLLEYELLMEEDTVLLDDKVQGRSVDELISNHAQQLNNSFDSRDEQVSLPSRFAVSVGRNSAANEQRRTGL
jgi:hypothetical protein